MYEDDDAIAQMVADWLRTNWDDYDDAGLEETSAGDTLSVSGAAVDVTETPGALHPRA